MFLHTTALGDKCSGLTYLAMMWLVPSPPERSAIMKAVCELTAKQGIH